VHTHEKVQYQRNILRGFKYGIAQFNFAANKGGGRVKGLKGEKWGTQTRCLWEGNISLTGGVAKGDVSRINEI